MEKASLGSLVSFGNGKTLPKDQGRIPAFGGNGVIGKVTTPNYPEKTLIVGRVGSQCGNVHKSDDACWVTDNALAGTPKHESDFEFFYYLLKQLKLNQLRVGSGQPLVTQSILHSLSVRIPSDIAYREKIAAVLSALDAKIELNNRINAELEAMAKLLYDYWFVQFDFPTSATQAAALGNPSLEGNPYKSSGGKMVYDPQLKREIPVGWGVETVGAILDSDNTGKKIPASEILQIGTIPVIDQSTDFICGFTNDADARIHGTPRIIFGDHTRILKFINFDFARGADGTQTLVSKLKCMPQHLFYHTLLKIDLSSYGYARHFKFLKQSNIILPDEKTAEQFEEITEVYYNLIRENIFQNQHLTTLRDWLLPMLMNGQVSVDSTTT